MKRRSFIQKALIVSGGITLTFKSFLAGAFSRVAPVTGKVSANGKGIANVQVSDGFSIVKTDSTGRYTLNAHPKAEFVFISTPAGYHFNQENYLASFYHRLPGGPDFDFRLSPLSKSDFKHGFIIWADPQVKDQSDVNKMMSTAVPDVQQLLNGWNKDEPVHGICVGDLVWDSHDLFPAYSKAVAMMGIPFFQTIGNHDMDYRMGGDETSDQTFKKHFGPTYYSFNRGKAHYVVLDDVRYLGVERTYDGYISEQQLSWLQQDLNLIAKDQLIIINLHIPVHNGVKNNTDLYALLKPFKNVHIMSGHTHWHQNNMTEGIYEHNHGTVCGAWWTGPICEDGTPNGYGVYHVEGTQLKWYYKSTGKDRSSQIALYGDELTGQKRVIANIWNWDPEWKVEYMADGKAMGALGKEMGYDPLSVKLMLGDQLPVLRKFPEPHKTDHIFVAHMDPFVKQVKVIATDRFGEKYESEINI